MCLGNTCLDEKDLETILNFTRNGDLCYNDICMNKKNLQNLSLLSKVNLLIVSLKDTVNISNVNENIDLLDNTSYDVLPEGSITTSFFKFKVLGTSKLSAPILLKVVVTSKIDNSIISEIVSATKIEPSTSDLTYIFHYQTTGFLEVSYKKAVIHLFFTSSDNTDFSLNIENFQSGIRMITTSPSTWLKS